MPGQEFSGMGCLKIFRAKGKGGGGAYSAPPHGLGVKNVWWMEGLHMRVDPNITAANTPPYTSLIIDHGSRGKRKKRFLMMQQLFDQE